MPVYTSSCVGTSAIVTFVPSIVTVPLVLVAVTLAAGASESVATSRPVSPTVTATDGAAIESTAGKA